MRPRPLDVAVAVAVTLPLLFWETGFHVVPAGIGLWRGLSEPPSALRLLAALAAGVLVAQLLAAQAAAVRRALLPLALAAAPLVPVATGALPVLLLFQGPVLGVLAVMCLLVALVRQQTGTSRTASGDAEPASRHRELALFAVAATFYALVGTRVPGPAGPQGDEPHYLVMAESLLRDGDLDLTNQFAARAYAPFFSGELQPHRSPVKPPGLVYSVHAPGLPALILPAYALGGYSGARLFVSLLAALTGVLVHRLVHQATRSGTLAAVGWACLTFAPPLPFYAVALYPETPAALASAVFLLSSRRDPGPGLLLAAAVSAAALPWLHPKFVPLAALGLGLTLLRRGSAQGRVGAALALLGSLALLLAYFHALYGRASFSAAYGPGFAADVSLSHLPRGAAGLLLDRQFGLLAIAPLWALALPGWGLLVRARPGDGLRAALLSGTTLAVGASFSMWWGGACPPARFVVPALPALALALAPALAARRDLAAALFGLGLAVVGLASEAPRALHNRGDGESALLRLLAPALDLDGALPSFVAADPAAWLLAATLLAAIALVWLRGAKGLAAAGLGYVLVASGLRERPLIDAPSAALGLLATWDERNLRGLSGPLELTGLAVPLELPGAPWRLRPLERRRSRRLDLPPGLYDVVVRGSVAEALPTAHVIRLDLAAGELLLARSYLIEGQPPPSFALLLPGGARRLALTATGIQGAGVLEAVRLVPEALVPRGKREWYPWPRVPDEERYRRAQGGLRVTALDRSQVEGDGFRLEGEQASFLLEVPWGYRALARIERPQPAAEDALTVERTRLPLSGPAALTLGLPPGSGAVLGDTLVVPVRLRSYGSWVGFSGSPGATSATEPISASPAARPSVINSSGPPDSANR